MKVKREYASDAVCRELVRTYFSYVKEEIPLITPSALSELLRYSLCVLFELESKGYDEFIEDSVGGVVKILSPLVVKYGIMGLSEDARRGILEACVHYIEIPMERIRKELVVV